MRSHDPIELMPPDPAWAPAFADEAAALTPLLAPWGLVALEHVGSTAIEGVEAKPIIDLMAGFRAIGDRDAAAPILVGRGYRFRSDDPDRDERLFFVRGQPPDAPRTHHLHAVLFESDWWRRHIAFRDRLRASAALREEYVALKRELAARHREDREAYTAGKTGFVERVLAMP